MRCGRSRSSRDSSEAKHEYTIELDGNRYCVDAARGDITPYASVWIEREYALDERFDPPSNGMVIDGTSR